MYPLLLTPVKWVSLKYAGTLWQTAESRTAQWPGVAPLWQIIGNYCPKSAGTYAEMPGYQTSRRHATYVSHSVLIVTIYLLKSGCPTVLHKAPRPQFGRAVGRSVDAALRQQVTLLAAAKQPHPAQALSVRYDYALRLKVHYSQQ